jgi:hypothetical protein
MQRFRVLRNATGGSSDQPHLQVMQVEGGLIANATEMQPGRSNEKEIAAFYVNRERSPSCVEDEGSVQVAAGLQLGFVWVMLGESTLSVGGRAGAAASSRR